MGLKQDSLNYKVDFMAYKVETAIHSFEEMKRKWDEDNPDKPYERSPEISGWYDLDKWLVRVTDEGKVIGTVGWREEPKYILLGGLRGRDDLGHTGNYKALTAARQERLPQGKPQIAGFKAGRGSQEDWVKTQSQFYNINPTDTQGIPEELIGKLKERYGNDWGIKKAWDWDTFNKAIWPDDPIPQWWSVMKAGISDNAWLRLKDAIIQDAYPKDRQRYVRFTNLGQDNKRMVIYYLRKGMENENQRSKLHNGILEEMLRSSNTRYDIEDGGR